MTVFLVYAFPFSIVLLLIVMQAEIPGQEQDGYDAEPNCLQGMHQVRAAVCRFPSLFTAFSNFPTTTPTTPWAPQKSEARDDEESSSSSTYHPTPSRRRCHLQN
jgi:hypothetical protein